MVQCNAGAWAMSEFGEGLGTAIEGGLLSRALEPGSGAREPDPHQPENCLNCGTGLVGAYCHACGQVGHVHRTIGAIMHDLLHGALHFEGKLWHTIPVLVFRPGPLTRRYIEGQRARFVSPMALFLFSVFLMFAVFQMLGISAPANVGISEETAGKAIAVSIDDSRSNRDALQQRLDAMAPDDPERAAVASDLEDAQDVVDGLEKARKAAGDWTSGANFNWTGIDLLDDKIVDKWRANPGLMLYKLQANSYKFSWLLIPISIPFVWLLFLWRRRFKAYDHAIFVTYSLCFMTLLFVLASVLLAAGVHAALVTLLMLLVPPLHIYKQLRGAYSLSRFSAFWRLLALSLFIWIIVLIFLELLVVIGAF